jgi:hypothetical protein
MKFDNNTFTASKAVKQSGWTEYGTNILLNGGMESWTGGNLDNWTFVNFGEGVTVLSQISGGHSGSYCAAISGTYEGSSLIGVLLQAKTNLTAGSQYALDGWAKLNSGTLEDSGVIVFNNSSIEGSDKVWNFNTKQWDAFTGFNNMQTGETFDINAASNWTNFQTEGITVPSTGTLLIVIYVSAEANFSFYLDDCRLRSFTYHPTSPIEVYSISNPSNKDNLDENDYLIRIRTTGGTPKDWIYVKGDGTGKLGNLEWGADGVPLNLPPNSQYAFKQVSSNYTITYDDTVIWTVSEITLTLPNAIGHAGKMFIIRNSGMGAVTINPISGQTIDSINTSYTLYSGAIRLMSTGSNWITI